jgi:hypothetical protein
MSPVLPESSQKKARGIYSLDALNGVEEISHTMYGVTGVVKDFIQRHCYDS